MKRLTDYCANKYSQFGEDGVIDKIFELIGEKSKICVEFGAWDGFHMSNTAKLWTGGWKGVLIEGNTKRVKRLKENVAKYDCLCICAYVQSSGDLSLEPLLEVAGITEQIDLLSIDIDGNDYFIFESLKEIRPRVVVCEYNPTIPAEIDLVAEEGNYFGCSVAALNRVGESKDYKLVAVTDTNCIFVLKKYEPLFEPYETRLSEIKVDKYLTYFMTSYSGEYVLSRDPVYGASFPFRGKLIGSYSSITFKASLFRPYYRFIRKLKEIWEAQVK